MRHAHRLVRSLPALAFLLATPSHAAPVPPGPVELAVDVRDAPRGIFHAIETIAVEPGPLTVTFPEWLPGEHAATGPVGDLAGLAFEVRLANGSTRALPWTRDPVDMYALSVVVPDGATSLTVRFDNLSVESNGSYVDGVSATPNLAVLSWNNVVLVPKGARADELLVHASLDLPPGWQYGTALAPAAAVGAAGHVAFAPVTLERLVDSPVACGRYARTIPLAPDLRPSHRAFLVADSEAALAVPPDLIAGWERMVRETVKLFGATHYGSYTFLVALSDPLEHFGLEHHESSDNRMMERDLIEPAGRAANAELMSHEFVHSWNGKYRRPEGLATPDFETRIRTPLLWIYEGLTEYYGWVLAGRSGLLSPRDAREVTALRAAGLAHESGRRWRPLVDTAVASQSLQVSPSAFANWRRSLDYYGEGALLWLEADTRIRAATGGKRSLDDFCRDFYGGLSGPPRVVPYTLSDVVATLDRVAPGDWARFFAQRVDSVRVQPPLAGIEAAGWSVTYGDSANEYADQLDQSDERTDYRFSLGFRVSKDGTVPDVLPGSPAARAGMAPGMKLIAINGRLWTKDALDDALDATRPLPRDAARSTGGDDAGATGPRGRSTIEVVAAQGDFVGTYRLEGLTGPRIPALTRRPGTADVLARILAPRTTPKAGR